MAEQKKFKSVDTKHKDYVLMSSIWRKCRDLYEGSNAVKAAGDAYVPQPNGMDRREFNAYVERGQFFNGVRRTVEAMLGQVFQKNPSVDGNYDTAFYDNFDLSGRSFTEFSKDTARNLFIDGRVGVLVDFFGDTTNDVTRAQAEAVGARPYAICYPSQSIINWRTGVINGIDTPILIVLEETVNTSENIFSTSTAKQWRVLRLERSGTVLMYVQEVYKLASDSRGGESEFVLVSQIVPTINNVFLSYIPFYMIGNDGISYNITYPVINDLADVNVGHFRNSCDYENELHWNGVKTPIFPGWPKSEPIPMGKALAVEPESVPFILECSAGSALKDEMTAKESRMAVLGAQIIAQKGRYVEAAETARIQASGESGILAALSGTLSRVMSDIFTFIEFWAGTDTEIKVDFNTDFEPGILSAQEIVSMSSLVDSGKMSFETYFYNLQRGEVYPEGWTMEDEQAAIKAYKEKNTIEIPLPGFNQGQRPANMQIDDNDMDDADTTNANNMDDGR